VRNNSVIEFRADKYPVGEYHGEMKNFTEQSVDLEPGDMVYLFSDGYADQFGGPSGKKMKYRALRDILLESASLSCSEQSALLHKKFDEWKGNLEQVDDVIITGIRI
jgi:serine phosphatase RsbU (regulator of sigma subunit)